VGLASALAVWRLWSRRRREAAVPEPEVDPADELRRKLAETRSDETPTEDAVTADEPLEERRARVHAKAQEAIDAMRDEEA
jgi:hypothetical protein